MKVRRDAQKIKARHPLNVRNKPSVALRKYWWVIIRSIAYGDKNKLQFAPQACVLMDDFSDSMEALYADTLVPSINAGMLGKRGSFAVHWGPATVKSPKSERDAEQEVRGVPCVCLCCLRLPSVPRPERLFLHHAWGCGTGWRNLLKGWREDSRNLLHRSTFLVSSLYPSIQRRKVYFYAVYSNAQRVNFPGAPRLIISSRINTVQLRNFRVDPIKEILHSARARANWLWWQGLDKNQTRSFMHQ